MYTLIDSVDDVAIIKGSLMDCLNHVKNYEQQYVNDRQEKSLYLNENGSLIKDDESIESMVMDCEFLILEERTNLPINFIGISEQI